jgi:hypothetical protein
MTLASFPLIIELPLIVKPIMVLGDEVTPGRESG